MPLPAQRREISILGAANYTSATGPLLTEVEGHPGFAAGIGVRIPRSSRVAFESDFLVVHRRLTGRRAESTAPPTFAGPQADFARITYLEIPMLFRFQRPYSSNYPVRPFLVLGPSIAIRIGCSREIITAGGAVQDEGCPGTRSGTSTDPFVPALYQDVDLALQFGGGVEFRRIGIFARGMRSIRNLVDTGALPSSPFDGSKAWSVTAGLDYMLRVF